MDGDPNVAGWLTSAARALFAAGHRTHPRHEHQRAAELGAQAAAASLTPTNLIEAFLDAASLTAQDDPDLSAADLVAMTRHLAVAAIDGYQQHTRSELAQRDRDREQFVTDLLTGRADAGRLAARAQRYGIRLSAQHTVAVAHAPGVSVDLVHTIDDALAARFGAGNTLTSVHNGDLVCLYAGGLRGVPAELAHHLLTRLGSEGWQIGVGRPHPGPHGLVTSLGEARDTLDLAGRLGFSTPVLHAADLLVFPVLLRDRDAITDLVHTVLGPLTRARGGAQPLLDTLSVLFDQQGNHTATARAMHISVRAVTYRLDRIKALTGYHPNEPTQRFTLHTAVLGARLLDWPATHAAKQE
jgi:sugar diacid utilization regulator